MAVRRGLVILRGAIRFLVGSGVLSAWTVLGWLVKVGWVNKT